MGIRRNLRESFERIGGGTADFLDNVSEGVRQFACGLWATYPKWITEGNSPGSSFARGYMNNVCSIGGGTTIPNAPALPFSGGQCYKSYYVDAFFYNSDTGQAACGAVIEASTRYAFSPGYVTGRILSVGFVFDPNFGTDVLKVTYEIQNQAGTFTDTAILGKVGTGAQVILDPPCANKPGSNSLGYAVSQDLDSIVITAVDGIDDCGDLPSNYPDTTDPDPAVDFITNITINNEDGTDWTIPLVYAPVNFRFPMDFDLGGIDVTLDIGGIDFNFGDGDTSTDDPPALPDGQPHPLPAPGDNAPKTPAPTFIEPPPGELTCNHPDRPNLTDFDEETTTDVESQDEETPEAGEFKWVLTTVTTDPEGDTQIIFDNPGDNVIYAGWFAWTINVNGQLYRYPAMPIRKRHMAFPAPPNATGYRVYTIHSARISVSTYKVKQSQ